MVNSLQPEIVDVALDPQSSSGESLRLADQPTREDRTTQARAVPDRCERAGEQIGTFAWHLVARPLRRLGWRREMPADERSWECAAFDTAEDNCAGLSTVNLLTLTTTMKSPVPVEQPQSTQPPLVEPRGVAPATQQVRIMMDPGRQSSADSAQRIPFAQPVSQSRFWRTASAEAIDLLHPALLVRETLRHGIGEHPADVVLGAAGIVGLVLLGGNGVTHGDAFGLAAGTIPPLLAVSLLRWGVPSWAHLAEVTTAAVIHSTRTIHTSQQQKLRQHTSLALLTSIAFTVASIVTTVSPAALLHLATVSPWSLALLGGLIVLAIAVAALVSQRRLYASPSPEAI